MAFDATPGGASANSYVTVQEADDYFKLKLGTEAWHNLVLGKKQQALCHATLQLETINFKGVPLNSTQALAFPRYVVEERGEKFHYPSDTIPPDVKKACYEQAFWLVKHNGELTKRQQLQAQGVKSFSVDGFSETFGATAGGVSEVLLSAEARIHLRDWIFRVGQVVDFSRERRRRWSGIVNRGDCPDD